MPSTSWVEVAPFGNLDLLRKNKQNTEQENNKQDIMNTQTLIENKRRPATQVPAIKIKYTDLSRGASLNGLRASVFLEARVLEEYAELDPTLGQNTAGVILAVLGCHLAAGNGIGDDRLSVCLKRREDGQLVEVDLMLLRRRQAGGECLYLRRADVRLMASEFGD